MWREKTYMEEKFTPENDENNDIIEEDEDEYEKQLQKIIEADKKRNIIVDIITEIISYFG